MSYKTIRVRYGNVDWFEYTQTVTGAQSYYKLFNTNTENKISALNRWNDKLIDKHSWMTIFSMVHITSDNVLKWFQYCLIHRILCIKEYLVKKNQEESYKKDNSAL